MQIQFLFILVQYNYYFTYVSNSNSLISEMLTYHKKRTGMRQDTELIQIHIFYLNSFSLLCILKKIQGKILCSVTICNVFTLAAMGLYLH